MGRWLVRIVAFGFGLLLLTGCFKYEVNTAISNNGSGTNEMVIAITKEGQKQIEDMSKEMGGTAEDSDPLKQSEEAAKEFPEEWQAKVEPWEGEIDGEEASGSKTTLKFNDLGTLEDQLNQIWNTSASSASGSGDNPAGGLFQPFKVRNEGDNIIIETSANAKGDEEMQSNPMAGMVTGKIVWTVSMPTLSSATPADDPDVKVAGNKATARVC
jgi:hypothetical protein